MKRNLFRTIPILFLAVVMHSQINAQVAEIELHFPDHQQFNKTFVARDKVTFNPGYSFTANDSVSRVAYTDETILLPADYISTPPDAENRTLDHSLEVGTLPGAPSVSQTGAANYTIPIEVPPGTNGMQPNLSIVYNSQGGNGILGMKWQLAGLSAISRVGKTIYHDQKTEGIQFTTNDNLALDGNRLVLASGTHWADGAIYHTEIESFSKIVYNDPSSGSSYFSVTTKDGTVIEYGNTTKSRIESNGSNSEALLWLINKITDPFENYMEFEYIEDVGQGEYYIEKIKYTQNDASSLTLDHYNEVKFYYSERQDKSMRYINGSMRNDKKVLRKIKTFCCSSLALEYNFTYDLKSYTHLVKVEKIAMDGLKNNPTIIEWGNESVAFTSDNSTLTLDYDHVVTADFNGDGYGDILYHKGSLWGLHCWDPQTEAFSINQFSYSSTLPSSIQYIIPGDFNGDGRMDCLVPYKVKIDNINVIKICLFENLGSWFAPVYISNIGAIEDNHPEFRVGDFNGDGKQDISLYCEIPSEWYLYEFNNTTGEFDELTYYNGYSIEKYFIRDFNADGQDDFLIIADASASLRTFDGVSLHQIAQLGYPTKYHVVIPGDFNGDGNCDILTFCNGSWDIGISTGDDFAIDTNLVPPPPMQYDAFAPYYHHFSFDFNGDGKDDIFQGWSDPNLNNSIKKVHHFNGCNWDSEEEIYSFMANPFSYYQFGDINGDGSTDFFGWINNSNEYGAIFNHPYNNNQRVLHISNGMDIQTDFIYKPCTNTDVYDDDCCETYPLVDIVAPIWVVYQMETDNGVGTQNTMQYHYRGAKVHKQGRGFLGFYKVEQTDLTSDIVQTTQYLINEDKYYPYMSYQKTEIDGASPTLLSETTVSDIEFKEMYTAFNCSTFIPLVKESVAHNALKGTYQETVATYDDYANPVTQTVTSLNGTTPEWTTTAAYSSYSSEGTYYNNKPGQIVSTTNNLAVSGNFSTTSLYTYNANTGAVTSLITNPTDDLKTEEQFEYNDFGNVESTKLIAKTSPTGGVEERENTMDYEDYQRFAKQATNAEGHTSYVSHNPKNGAVLSQTGPNGLTTEFEYTSLAAKPKRFHP